MKRLVPLLALLLAAPAAAQAPHDPARLYSYEASIELPSAHGLVRLPLREDVLAGCRGDLSDLRIHDASAEERPYIVESGARVAGHVSTAEITPIEIDRRIEDGDSLAPRWREHLLVAPPYSAAGARWTLRFDSARPSFVRQVTVYQVDGDARTELARGTLFRLQDPLRERLFVRLPPTDATLIEIQVVGEGGYIEPSIRLVASRVPVEAPILELPLTEVGRTRSEGRTTIELARPRGMVPDRVRIRTSTGHFHRGVRVLDLALGEAPRELGHATLFRVREIEGAERLEVDVSRARGDVLRIEIDDGDSPSLGDLEVYAVVRQPSLLFDSDGSAVVLRFGAGRARAPRYDVQRLAGTVLGDMIGASHLPEASLGPVRDNPRFDDAPALRFAMRPGRAVDSSAYRYVASLVVEGAAEGLSRVRLTPSILAAARADLADVRIVGDDGHQWPYLVAAAEVVELPAAIAAPTTEGRESRYVVELPEAFATVEALVLVTDAPFVSRPYELYGLDEHERRVLLTTGRLVREPEEARPIELTFGPRRVSQITLVVTDGSDAPLAFSGAIIRVPSPTLYLAAPDGDYRVLAGHPEATAPSYEIEQARALVLSVRSVDARVGDAGPNPAHVEPPWYETSDWGAWIVWAVLLFAILLLGFLTIRVARRPDAEGEDESEPLEF